MKQVFQNLKNGRTEVSDIPCPTVRPGQVLIRTCASVISAGTERMLVEFGRANFLDKARQQPDKVRQVLNKIKTDGLGPTLDAVRSKLDQPLPLGYSNAGVVIEVGPGVDGLAAGDRVASNGPHAEIVSVPQNLCARIPDAVPDEQAAFTTIAAIALQGIRLAQPALGERFVVTGLGLIGLMAVQLLRAHGCLVLGIDLDPRKIELARRFGAETADLSQGVDPLAAAAAFSQGRGVDGVLITASTKSSEPVHQAAQMCRKRGRIVLVGVTGLELSRADFYEKELTFQVSCSYGPGRYDPAYEANGRDYPFGFVRWTEQRNFEAVLDMLAEGRLNLEPLITHRFDLDRTADAYEILNGTEPYLGILLKYPTPSPEADTRRMSRRISLAAPPDAGSHPITAGSPSPVLGVIGAGNYATRILLPAFKKTAARLKVVSSSAATAGYAGRKFGFEQAATDSAAILTDPEIDALVVATRHDTHARLVCDALQNGKHVFVEKPLCIDRAQLEQIRAAYQHAQQNGAPRILMVGFNRRFAPQTRTIKQLLGSVVEPKLLIMTVNAGRIPADHWTQNPAVGGGRIIGEACHFIDLIRHLVGRPIAAVQAAGLGGDALRDNASFTLSFDDGSLGVVHYLANGHASFPKERLEVFCGGRVLALDNFRRLTAYGWPGFKKSNLWRQDKGQASEVQAFVDAVRDNRMAPIPFEEIVEVTGISFDVAGLLGQQV